MHVLGSTLVALMLKYKTSRDLTELALVVGAVGGLAVAFGGGRSRAALVVGGLLITIAFGLLVITVHFGVAPFRR